MRPPDRPQSQRLLFSELAPAIEAGYRTRLPDPHAPNGVFSAPIDSQLPLALPLGHVLAHCVVVLPAAVVQHVHIPRKAPTSPLRRSPADGVVRAATWLDGDLLACLISVRALRRAQSSLA